MSIFDNKDKKIVEYVKKNPFSTLSDIRRSGIVKNYPYLSKRLEKLVMYGKLEYLPYCNKYYAEPLPDNLKIFGVIRKHIEQVFSQLANNQNLKQAKFFKDCQTAYKIASQYGGTKNAKAKRALKLLPYHYGLVEWLGPDNEQCLRKWLIIFLFEAIIWELEINKLKGKSIYVHNPDDETLANAMLFPLLKFKLFLENYDPANHTSFLGISYKQLVVELDLTYLLDLEYYKELKSNKIPMKVEINSYMNYLLNGNKKDASRIYLDLKKGSERYSKHLEKILAKQKNEELERKHQRLENKLTLEMKKEKKKKKNYGREDEVQHHFQNMLRESKEEISIEINKKYEEKLEKKLADRYPKTEKPITRMIKSLQDGSDKPDIYKMFLRRKGEANRILFGEVTHKELEGLVLLYSIRERIKQIPKGTKDYNKLQKFVRKEMPELVIP